MSLVDYLKESATALDRTIDTFRSERMERAIAVIVEALAANKPLLVCGNGGSASDSMHIAGELVGRFLKERRAINCICLSSNPAVVTAWSNDYSYDTVFARQVEAYGRSGGVLLGISTSGNSQNVLTAFRVAQQMSMKTIALTGEGGGKLKAHSDVLLDVPSKRTPIIQQLHICLYHYLCDRVEQAVAAQEIEERALPDVSPTMSEACKAESVN
jgi:D-sedoheptulose 7-phosphate isomerase